MQLQTFRPLILRSNRSLASMLLEKKLVSQEQLDAANEKLVEHIQNGELRRANLLHVLLFEMQVLSEDLYIDAVVEKYGLGLMDLHGCQFRKLADLKIEPMACWATWTLPFDTVEDFYFLATACYPSQPIIKFWQEKYNGANLIWYATGVRSLHAALERLEQQLGELSKIPNQNPAKTASTTKSPAPHIPGKN